MSIEQTDTIDFVPLVGKFLMSKTAGILFEKVRALIAIDALKLRCNGD